MIVLNELRSGRWEALHTESQVRGRGPDREEALKQLAEGLAVRSQWKLLFNGRDLIWPVDDGETEIWENGKWRRSKS